MPDATLDPTGAMVSGSFSLTFFKESDTNLQANTDSKSLISVQIAFSKDTTDSCDLDAPPPSAPESIQSDLTLELTDNSQEVFAVTIGVNKTASTGGIGLHYHENDLGLISLGVTGTVNNFPEDTTGQFTYTITMPGTVKVKWREGKNKDHVTLVCNFVDSVTVTITKS